MKLSLSHWYPWSGVVLDCFDSWSFLSFFYFLYRANACLTADPGVTSLIPARSHSFVEIAHEIISTVILLLPLIYSRRVVVSYKRKYVHELLVNRLFKPAQEKVWLGEMTVPQ